MRVNEAFLAQQHLKLCIYSSGIRCLQIQKAMGNPFADRTMHVSSMFKVKTCRGSVCTVKTPIHDTHCASPGFFEFLRAGKFTVPFPQSYDPEVHLNLANLALDSHTQPTMVRITSGSLGCGAVYGMVCGGLIGWANGCAACVTIRQW